MRITIDHTLTVTLPPGFSQAVFHLLLTPASGPSQTVESWSVEMPGIGNAGRFTDGFGNTAHLVNQPKVEGEVRVHVRGVVTTRDTNGVLGRPGGEPVPALYRRVTAMTKAGALHEGLKEEKPNRLDCLHALMKRVADELDEGEDGRDAPTQTQMQADGGQSQSQSATKDADAETPRPASDYAHLFIAGARALDIPARYVTGYRLVEDDALAFHAWAEAFDEALGWIGFDPSEQICPTERYVRLAVGLDAETTPPLRTVPVGEIEQTVSVTATA